MSNNRLDSLFGEDKNTSKKPGAGLGEARRRKQVNNTGNSPTRRPVNTQARSRSDASGYGVGSSVKSMMHKIGSTISNFCKRNKAILGPLVLPVAFLYFEIVFRIVYAEHFFSYALFLTILFSLLYGLIANLFCGFFKNPVINHWIKVGIMAVVAFVPTVEYFMLRQFKVLYDVKTITGGASDVITGGFFGQMMASIFSFKGLRIIFFMLLPTVLYIIFWRKIDRARRYKLENFIRLGSGIIVLVLLLLACVNIPSSYRRNYGKQYNFQTAASSFGILTATRLDIKKNMSKSSSSFEIIEEETTEEPTGETETGEVVVPVVYGKNELDIDFAALAEESSGIYAEMDAYVASLTASSQNEYTGLFKGKNLIMITAEAFAAEVIDPELTPTLYRLATKGINFTNYYHQATAGTIGGEYENVFGLLPENGGMSFEYMAENLNYYTMGSQLDRLGYYGIAYHNNDYTYYSRHITHNSIGYSEGFYGIGNGVEEFVSTNEWPESDLQLFEGTVDDLIANQPFNAYYMTVSGHSQYFWSQNTQSQKHQAEIEATGIEYSEPVGAYLASQLELEAGLAYLVDALEKAGIADDTVICIAPDHFPYGLDDDAALGSLVYLSELYGYDVLDNFQKFHNRLIIWSGCLEDEEPIIVDDPTSPLDIVPTLSNLFGTEFDSRLMIGRDVFSDALPVYFDMSYSWETDKGRYYSTTGTFVPADDSVSVDDAYISRINSIISNKMIFGAQIANYDYYRHIFGD